MSTPVAVSDDEWSADELIPFGKYILLDRINSGATAAVYRANVRGEAGFERLVAIKRILPHMAGDRDFVDTFVREAKTVARLAHAGICPIYELGKVGESLYMAVEYIQGRDLGQIMRRLARRGETMPAVIAGWIAARLSDALDYAHNLKNTKGVRKGMIHRDLSPSNILVSYEGQVKLIDFGLARAVGRAQSTNVDALKKKLSYMSPEMVKGRQLDARSDIFGVGICLYEMVTARRLFAAQNDIETLKLVGKASVPPPSAVVDDAPDELEIVIMHALEREPEDRFQNAAEMGEALNAFLQKADPTFNTQRLADWMQELFAEEITAEQQRIKVLLAASADRDLIKRRRTFFASASGAAARARAEIERRLSTEPPPAHLALPGTLPKVAPIPKEAARPAPPTGAFDEEPTGFYDGDKTVAAPPDHALQAFENEPIGHHDESQQGDRPGGFEDEPTHYLLDHELKEAEEAAKDDGAAAIGTGGFDEEPTEIFFNKEEGVGIQELMDEINDVEPAAPLNKPIIAPELGLLAPAIPIQPALPLAPAAPVSMRPQPQARASVAPPAAWSPSSTVQSSPIRLQGAAAQRPASLWPFVAGTLLLLATIAALIVRTPVGVALGFRARPAGTIEVRTTPAVPANVELDDVYRGHAPLRMQGVPSGMRHLEIRADGFVPVVKDVQLERGGTALLDIALIADHPVAAPTPPTNQAGEPETNGPSAHGANEQQGSSSSGEHHHHHHASTSQPSGEGDDLPSQPAAASATASAAQPQPMQPQLHPARVPPATVNAQSTLSISTVPWSLIYIDGRDSGRSTPLLGYPIAPGVHEIRLQTATGQVHVERIQVQPGQSVQLTRRF